MTHIPQVTQVQQTLHVDVFFVKQLSFILSVMKPLGVVQVAHIADRSLSTISTALNRFIKKAKSRDFDIQALHSDGEGAIHSMIPELHSHGITVVSAGPGAHVPVAERYIQTIKGQVRSFEYSLSYVMTRTILFFYALFCTAAMNQVIPTNHDLRVSPHEQFTGRKLNMATDLRFGFGDYVQATVTNTDNTMKTRTEGCIALLSTGSSKGPCDCCIWPQTELSHETNLRSSRCPILLHPISRRRLFDRDTPVSGRSRIINLQSSSSLRSTHWHADSSTVRY